MAAIEIAASFRRRLLPREVVRRVITATHRAGCIGGRMQP